MRWPTTPPSRCPPTLCMVSKVVGSCRSEGMGSRSSSTFVADPGGHSSSPLSRRSSPHGSIESVRFEPWQPGDSRNGWATVDLGFETRPVVQQAGIEWLALSQGRGAANYGSVYTYKGRASCSVPCRTAGRVRTRRRASTRAVPSSSVRMARNKDGPWTVSRSLGTRPRSSNPWSPHPVITAWDGTLLTSRDYTL